MRKEINLDEQNIIPWLQLAANKKKWSLKKYMEVVLCNDAEKIKNRQSSSSSTPRNTEKNQVH